VINIVASAFAVKIVVAPALIGVASWIARRWGPSVGGWFAALPLTSGPVLFLLALERGPVFARAACVGALLAITSLSAFALAYSWSARRVSWQWSSIAGCAAYVACTLMLAPFSTSLAWTFLAVSVILTATISIFPAGPNEGRRTRAPAWEIPVRMALAAAMVWGLTSVAASVGPRVSGLLTPFPVAATILAAFTHRLEGGRAASQLLRSLLIGLFAFAVFLLVVGTTIEHWTVGAAFVAATVATLAVHAFVWHWILEPSGVRRPPTASKAIGA
jgi:hypothetical protein